ncbi:hypothetical protein NQ315_000315 [Exocentrus adspersus]|uniref:MD-2-related lipid-recognition domain-containing protein n=1 Tax=Exocentrus adspersus TaxID=1586481 RepID=A0AAV8VS18_9CUCU|nr:hypothetical protein NQ315_000315 [Exocentrus adspersus]
MYPILTPARALLIVVILLRIPKAIKSRNAPKYIIDIERFEQCSEYPDIESPMLNQKFSKINRTTRVFSYETDLKRPMDENIGIQADLERWSSNGWTKLPFIPLQPDACNLFSKLLGELWVDLKRHMGVKEPEKCPIPVGHYGMKDYMYDTSKLGGFAPFKGRFRYKIMLTDIRSKEVVQCIFAVLHVTDEV